MSERTERFKARKAALRDNPKGSSAMAIADTELVRQHKESDFNQERQDIDSANREAYYGLETDIEIDEAQVKALLADIEGKIKTEHINAVLESAMQTAVQNIGNQFGLGRVITKEFSDTVEYRRKDYENYKVKKVMQSVRQSGKSDAYTGKRPKQPEAEHIVSLKEFHEKEGWYLTREQKTQFAADFKNLATVDRSSNRSKGSDSLDDFEQRNQKARKEGQERVDSRRTRPLKKRSGEAHSEHRATPLDKAKFVGREGLASGVRMGLQQALGLVLEELTLALFEEAKDIFRVGLRETGESFWEALERRASRILIEVKDKWKEVLEAFGEGMISGFLSLIMEVILKALKGTAQRMGRLIRESIHSLVKAAKLLLFPPENMSFSEAAHEATKILTGCLIVGIGMGAEQAVNGLLIPLIGPAASWVAPVLLGIVTGLIAAFAAYGLDKLDIFGAQEKKRREGVFEELAARREAALEEIDEAVDFFLAPILPDPAG